MRITVEEVTPESEPVNDEQQLAADSSRSVFSAGARPHAVRPRRFHVECLSSGLRFLMDMSVRVSPLDLAVPLRMYAERRLRSALGACESRIDAVEIRVAEAKHGRADKTCVMTIDMRPGGRAVADASDSNVYTAVDRAASRLRAVLFSYCNGRQSPESA